MCHVPMIIFVYQTLNETICTACMKWQGFVTLLYLSYSHDFSKSIEPKTIQIS